MPITEENRTMGDRGIVNSQPKTLYGKRVILKNEKCNGGYIENIL